MKRIICVIAALTSTLVSSAGCEDDGGGDGCAVPECCLVPDPGDCEAMIPKWYYEPETGKCTEFTWGGCGGTVPFETEQECEEACEVP